MKTPVIATVLFAITIPAIAQNPRLRVTTESTTGGAGQIRVRNLSTVPLRAVHLHLVCPTGIINVDHDPLVNYGAYTVGESGDDLILPLSVQRMNCSSEIDGAIFQDGYMEGSSDRVTDMIAWRRGVSLALADAIPVFEGIADGSILPGAAIDQLRSRSFSTRMNTARAAGEREAYGYICGKMIGVIQTGFTFRVPTDSTAHHVPGVQKLMESGTLTKDQAVAKVTLSKIAEWQMDLRAAGVVTDASQS